jgi:hypothetical protein
MSDVLIRDVPEGVIAAIDAHAASLGLSRNEYLRRQLHQDAQRLRSAITVADLKRLSTLIGDLDDPEVMSGAWS